jgi:hypothetical protein
MNITREQLLETQRELKKLSETAVEFLEDVGYVNKGTYEGNTEQMLLNEGKREIVLTINTFRALTPEELLSRFTEEEQL